MKRKVIPFLISASMTVSLLAGCQTTSEEEVPAGTNTDSVSSQSVTDDESHSGEITEINYWTWEAGDGTAGSNTLGEEVEAAINAITEEKIGVHVNFNWINGADLY